MEDGTVNVDLLALIIPVVVLVLLVFGMRWTSQRSRSPLSRSGNAADTDMLDVVVAGVPRAEAVDASGKLREAGIQASMVQSDNGEIDVLVSHDDVDAAVELLKRG